ncbi:M12 family metallopeptidase [Paenibacillus sp. PCH8]|uniref:M12 family metallopeptidase n=1 Tax=Paenibacillus sp. PCH8 TaxID=2066524 RepID=UPI0015E3C0B5|nr:M12 family metallopeptidase [Paenibacillus sp. PCH8]
MKNQDQSMELYAPDLLEKGVPEEGYLFLVDSKTAIKVNYMEYDQLAIFDGDIVVSDAAKMKTFTAHVEGLLSVGKEVVPHPDVIIDIRRLWPHGQVYYAFDSTVNSQNRTDILQAMKLISSACRGVSFTERTTQPNYISFIMGTGCSSSVGMQGGIQRITLASTWYVIGNIIHEIGHALGLLHEHIKPNRNEYVTLHQNNVIPAARHNFDIISHPELFKSMDYDYGSIMHYSRSAFALIPGTDTLTPKQATDSMGQRKALSDLDIIGINSLYTSNSMFQESQ